MKLTVHHLVSRLRVDDTVLQLSCMSSWLAQDILNLTFTFFKFSEGNWKIYSTFHYAYNLLVLESGLTLGEIVDTPSAPVNSVNYNSL